MAEIYVIVKGAREITGEFMMAACERAFRNPELAQQWLKGQPVVWEETINGAECQCERAIHLVDLVE